MSHFRLPRALAIAVVCVGIGAAVCTAAKVKVWDQRTPASFDKAQFRGTASAATASSVSAACCGRSPTWMSTTSGT